jgi:hypothetical protein
MSTVRAPQQPDATIGAAHRKEGSAAMHTVGARGRLQWQAGAFYSQLFIQPGHLRMAASAPGQSLDSQPLPERLWPGDCLPRPLTRVKIGAATIQKSTRGNRCMQAVLVYWVACSRVRRHQRHRTRPLAPRGTRGKQQRCARGLWGIPAHTQPTGTNNW